MYQKPEDPAVIMTIERHILQEQIQHPEATGVLTQLLYDIALAGKVIASRTTRAGLAEILGRTDDVNIQGEVVQKLDRFADLTIFRLCDHTGRLAIMASEENEQPLLVPEKYPKGKYVLLFDPLDGSSNIDFNIPVGTIFSIYCRTSPDGTPGTLEDCLQPGKNLIAAGYILYGSSTMLVYSTGQGVNGFTLDPGVGEFILSHPNIKIPVDPAYFSVNLGYRKFWSQGVNHYTDYLQGMYAGGMDAQGKHAQGMEGQFKALSLRYVGSLVADFHRNLLAGGVFYYPADHRDPKKPQGKLRLAYEAAPLAFLAEQAGGYASDGRRSILSITPKGLHERIPLFIGNRGLVEKAEEFIREHDLEPVE